MFDDKGMLTEALVTRDDYQVTIVRVTSFKTMVEAEAFHNKMLAQIETEFKAQNVPFEHALVEVDNVS